jgi:AcrR family transcriptional regulator
MRRDPEATKARILEAARAEFAEHGVHGARYDRIAVQAQANKERIYAYFGEKEALFAAVLTEQMALVAEAHLIRDAQPLADHAGELFDFHLAHPDLVRLLLWEALHYGAAEVPGEEVRADHYRRRRETVRQLVARSDAWADDPTDPGHLSLLLTSLVAWWFAAPQVARLHVDGDVADPVVQQRHRQLIVDLAHRLVEAAGRDGVPRPTG